MSLALVAFGLRGIALAELAREPWFGIALGDARAYLLWAEEIAAGDWLGASRGVFYQAPLLPYLLALALELGASSVVQLIWLQVALDTATTAIVAAVARRAVSPAAGWLAGGFYAVYPPVIHAALGLEKTSLALWLGAIVAWLLVSSGRDASPARSAALGAAIGLFALTRENALVLVPVVTLAALVSAWRSDGVARRKAVARAAALLLGTALVLSPFALRNFVVAGDLVVTTAQSGPNFYIGNRRGARGSYAPLVPARGDARFERDDARLSAERATGRALSPGEVSAHFWRLAAQEIRADPTGWLRLLARKARLLVHRGEIADFDDLGLASESSRVLAASRFLHFGLLAPLAAAGFALAIARRRSEVLRLGAAALALGGTLVAFYLFGRYRLVLVPFLLPAAALTLARFGWPPNVVAWCRAPASRSALGAAVLVALAANLPVSGLSVGSDRAIALSNVGHATALAGHFDRAEQLFRAALARRPDLAEAAAGLAGLLLSTDRAALARPYAEQALRASPGDAELLHLAGRVDLELGELERAVERLSAALELEPASTGIARDLAAARARAASDQPSAGSRQGSPTR